MKKLLFILVFSTVMAAAAQPKAERVVHNNPEEYRNLSSVHAGAGEMGFTQLIGRNDLTANFLYLHAGEIQGKSGIGHHFHHSIEEMYVLLSGEAEFTVNGRTSVLKAPVVVPCKLGDSHAVYNSSDQPVKWLNFAVSEKKGRGDAFDLGDDRVGASVDPQPVFVSGELKMDALRDSNHPYAENGIKFRRLLGPEIFSTNWDHVDHLVIPAGKSLDLQIGNIEEVFYVVSGNGTVSMNEQSREIGKDDALAGLLGENLSISNTGNTSLELLAIGIAVANKDQADDLNEPKAIALQMDFVVPEENHKAFEDMYRSVYVPAMTVQKGYLESKLLRLFPDNLANEIQAAETKYNYSIQIYFDSEQSRRNWVASDQHKIAWPAAEKLVTAYQWRGYDVMGDDRQ